MATIGRAPTVAALSTFPADAASMVVVEAVAGLDETVGAAGRTLARPGVVRGLVVVGGVGAGEVELAHFGVVLARVVVHEQRFAGIQGSEVIDITAHFF